MTTRFRNTRRGRVPAQTRKFVWARQEIDLVVAAASSSAVNLFGNFETEYGAQLLGSTVMRVRGLLEFEPAAAATSVNAAGIRVDLDGQSGNGPLTAKHLDWMAFEPVVVNSADPTLQIHRWVVDVKSNRRVEELGEALHLVIQNATVGVAMDVRGVLSVGVKLP